MGAIKVVAGHGTPPSLLHAVIACGRALSAIGAGFALTRNGGLLEPLVAGDPVSAGLDELQSTLGEGPSNDVVRVGVPVLEPNLADHRAVQRWPVFAPAATERGVHGVFAFPVGLGAAMVGALTVYRQQAEPLRPQALQDALVFTDAVLVLALDYGNRINSGADHLIEATFSTRRAEVHQAAGVVAAREDISVTDALARLRAQAYSSGRPLYEIAAQVMADQLRRNEQSRQSEVQPRSAHDAAAENADKGKD
ncbi:MAG: ANTAR domain-containing protein [Kribbellaceae bacterium]|nr:ANTAR domain-containing protein [Kribbellaceae bacterium]